MLFTTLKRETVGLYTVTFNGLRIEFNTLRQALSCIKTYGHRPDLLKAVQAIHATLKEQHRTPRRLISLMKAL